MRWRAIEKCVYKFIYSFTHSICRYFLWHVFFPFCSLQSLWTYPTFICSCIVFCVLVAYFFYWDCVVSVRWFFLSFVFLFLSFNSHVGRSRKLSKASDTNTTTIWSSLSLSVFVFLCAKRKNNNTRSTLRRCALSLVCCLPLHWFGVYVEKCHLVWFHHHHHHWPSVVVVIIIIDEKPNISNGSRRIGRCKIMSTH